MSENATNTGQLDNVTRKVDELEKKDVDFVSKEMYNKQLASKESELAEAYKRLKHLESEKSQAQQELESLKITAEELEELRKKTASDEAAAHGYTAEEVAQMQAEAAAKIEEANKRAAAADARRHRETTIRNIMNTHAQDVPADMREFIEHKLEQMVGIDDDGQEYVRDAKGNKQYHTDTHRPKTSADAVDALRKLHPSAFGSPVLSGSMQAGQMITQPVAKSVEEVDLDKFQRDAQYREQLGNTLRVATYKKLEAMGKTFRR